MGAALMEGSSETTTTTLKNFVAAMISYPQYQERAHEEMDRVVGHDRFPELADIPNLKYMNAIIDEVSFFDRLHLIKKLSCPLGHPNETSFPQWRSPCCCTR